MFNEHGSFEMLEVQVKKKFARSREHAKSGGWVTKHWLETKEGYTKQGSQTLGLQPTVSNCTCIFKPITLVSIPHNPIEADDPESFGLGPQDREHPN